MSAPDRPERPDRPEADTAATRPCGVCGGVRIPEPGGGWACRACNRRHMRVRRLMLAEFIRRYPDEAAEIRAACRAIAFGGTR